MTLHPTASFAPLLTTPPYCDRSGEWWRSYATVYDAASKWASRKPSHAPFCYELLVAMLALASSAAALPASGGVVVTSARRERLVGGLIAGCKARDKEVCVR